MSKDFEIPTELFANLVGNHDPQPITFRYMADGSGGIENVNKVVFEKIRTPSFEFEIVDRDGNAWLGGLLITGGASVGDTVEVGPGKLQLLGGNYPDEKDPPMNDSGVYQIIDDAVAKINEITDDAVARINELRAENASLRRIIRAVADSVQVGMPKLAEALRIVANDEQKERE